MFFKELTERAGPALWDMYLALGGDSKKKEERGMARERSITLLLESYFFLNPLSKFTDGADAIITANTHLFAGKDDVLLLPMHSGFLTQKRKISSKVYNKL